MKRIPIWSLILFLLPLSLLTATERLPYRISYIQGEAMVQRGYDEGFEEASINTPLVEGDRLTVENGRLEVDLGNRSYLRMDKGSDVVIGGVDRKEGRLQIDLRRGVVILALDNLDKEGDLVVGAIRKRSRLNDLSKVCNSCFLPKNRCVARKFAAGGHGQSRSPPAFNSRDHLAAWGRTGFLDEVRPKHFKPPRR